MSRMSPGSGATESMTTGLLSTFSTPVVRSNSLRRDPAREDCLVANLERQTDKARRSLAGASMKEVLDRNSSQYNFSLPRRLPRDAEGRESENLGKLCGVPRA